MCVPTWLDVVMIWPLAPWPMCAPARRLKYWMPSGMYDGHGGVCTLRRIVRSNICALSRKSMNWLLFMLGPFVFF